MHAPIYQLDAFTSRRFAGNPAAVVVLDRYVEDVVLQAVAAENNLSETAFLVPDGDGDYAIRWFTPTVEVALCGHATLAAAAVVLERLEPGRLRVTFASASGPLPVVRTGAGFRMSFPARPAAPVEISPSLVEALRATPSASLATNDTLLAVFDRPEQVRELAPSIAAIARLEATGLIVSAPGEGPYDFVSRYFTPRHGIPEDPVTGSAHCTLAPYWGARLASASLRAYQASRRGGEVACHLVEDRVDLEGNCVFFLEGGITL